HAAVPCLEQLQYSHIVEDALDELSSCFPEAAAPSDAVLLLMLLQDAWIGAFITTTYGEQVMQQTSALVARAHDASQRDLVRIILRERNRWAANIAGKITEKIMIRPGHSGVRIARLARHPVWGWFMLAGVVYITFVLVGQVAAGMLAVAIEEVLFAPLNEMIAASIKSAFLEDFLIGPYGILTTGLENAIGTVLPILTMFFLVLNFLEDVGYIPNLAVLCNRLFRRVGLSGKAILPVVLGFGCKTMATLATKMLDSKKERYIAIFLIAFAIPCSSQLGVNLAILALFPFKAFVIVFGVLAAAELVVGLVLNRLLPEEQETDFIMELPPIRLPQVKNLLIKTYYRLKWFLMEAIPLFVAGALVLFVLEKTGMLGLIKQTVFPVIVSFLDLPIVTVDAFLLCLARHEAGAVILLEMVRDGTLDYIQTLVSVVMVTCFVPCFANVMAMIKELGLVRALVMVLVIIVCSIIIGGGVNWVLRI
ncbi:MAG: ferrous iron transporter B, partial [Deltaproteobacteria bacterium]|nr:ferrous iron transporter B [Deltaproteobacteria bacterium]